MPSNAEHRRSTPRSRTEAPKDAPVRPVRRGSKAQRPPEGAAVMTVDEPKVEIEGDETIEVRVAKGPDGLPVVLG